MDKFKVTFLPDKKTVEVERHKTVLSAAISAGIYINSVCGGDGVCGKCKIILRKGILSSPSTGMLSREETEKNVYLACLASFESDAVIEVPQESRIEFEVPKACAAGEGEQAEEIRLPRAVEGRREKLLPLCEKMFLSLPKPDAHDNISDLDRIYREMDKTGKITSPTTALVNLRSLPRLLRDADWKVTVTIARRRTRSEIVSFEPGDTSENNLGIAFDIGTTTVSGQLIDLKTGKVLGTKAAYNRQAAYGPDIITRIIYSQKREGLKTLHDAVTDTLNLIIDGFVREYSLDLNTITCVFIAGNTTMMHLLLQVDPRHIRRDPYVPAFSSFPGIRAQEVGVFINPRGLLYIAPGISSYVGGDVTAGILACGMDTAKELCLLIDIGTNGEIVLGNSEFLIATSASAGPAFEGSGQSSGMRSAAGAIQKVRIGEGDAIELDCIEGAAPKGICGSGYIDCVAQLLAKGIMDKNGRLVTGSSPRVRQTSEGAEFVLCRKGDHGSARDIVINEADIENIKRAKAAIYSAVSILVRKMSFSMGDIKKIFVAGGFGTSLDIASAVAIGLLPDAEKGVFSFVGNTSLAGARQMLLAQELYRISGHVAGKTTYLELSGDHEYMDEYTAALFFPHTDMGRFPSLTDPTS
ncbi:MAG: ASKHA domain-containing protein [Deltaproteobacteria bacterium]